MDKFAYPNESQDYRQARQKLLIAEMALRAQVEAVAEQRRALPAGGNVTEDYQFDERVGTTTRKTRFADLLAPEHNDLLIYSFMYAPSMDNACPLCTAFLDSLDRQAAHLSQQVSLAVVAGHDIETLARFADDRGWQQLRLLSTAGTSYNRDYFGEIDGRQMPMINAFKRDGDAIRHLWGSEMLMAPSPEGQNSRHIDMAWPLWNLLDMTGHGRGENWFPSLSYD